MDFNNTNTKIPTLRQAESSFQRYRNPLNECHHKSESNSFEHKQGDLQYPIQQFPYFQSTPIFPILGFLYCNYEGEPKNEFVETANQFIKHGMQNSLASMIQKQSIVQNEFKLNQTTYGCKKMCEIDCMLVERYFNQKYWIFQNSNQKYQLDQTKTKNTDWLKARMQHRYKSQIYDAFSEMIDLIFKEGEIQMNSRTHLIKIQNLKGFQNLERQIQKAVKAEKKFDVFLFEIQKVLADFIFSTLN